jgi:hypothetical protein
MGTPVVARETSRLFLDRRDQGRCLRVTWHPLDDMFVLSTWRDGVCASTVQLPRSDAPGLIGALAYGLADTSSRWTAPNYSALPETSGWARFTHALKRRATRSR